MGSDATVFAAGALSGIVEGLCVQPLELVKTRFQINDGPPLRFWATVSDIVREGGVLHLYRGGLPEILGLVPRAAAALSTLTYSHELFRSWHQGELPAAYAYLSGALSGVPEAVAFSPFQVIKVRLMAKEHLGRYHNAADCLTKVVKAEGLSALAIGLGPTLLRNTVWNCIYYGTVFELDKHLPPVNDRILEGARSVLVGTGVGVLATCFNAPFDVIKSRVQSQLPGMRRYHGTFSALATIRREEGARALYKGFLPKALRLGLGQTIGLMTFKEIMKLVTAAKASGSL